MGTRSTITFCRKRGDTIKPIVNIFQMYDGYLEGVGEDLCTWLSKKIIVDGIASYKSTSEANGVGDLVAQYIVKNKDGVGGLYIVPIGERVSECDYNYVVIINADAKKPYRADDETVICVGSWGEDYFFVGTPQELLDYIKNLDKDE